MMFLWFFTFTILACLAKCLDTTGLDESVFFYFRLTQSTDDSAGNSPKYQMAKTGTIFRFFPLGSGWWGVNVENNVLFFFPIKYYLKFQ